jgi:hypothetical protein
MNESNAYEVEHADFDLDQEDPSQFEGYDDQYDDPLEQRLGQVEQHLAGIREDTQAREREEAELEFDEGIDALIEAYPELAGESEAADGLAEACWEIAEEIEEEEGQPGLAEWLVQDPRFVADVWTTALDSGARLPNEGGDAVFFQLAREAKAHRLAWD